MPLRRYLLGTTALASFGAVWLAAAGYAADIPTKAPPQVTPTAGSDPAVSGVNFKIDGFGGWQDATGGVHDRNHSGDIGGADASLTVPLGERFGFQADGLGGVWGNTSFWGAGGHLFWRDPSVGLLGAVGSWTQLNRGPWQFIGVGQGINITNVGLEGEAYLNAVTLRGVGGWEGGQVTSRGFVRADVRWYALNDFMLSAGYRYTAGLNALALGAEWLTPVDILSSRMSLFAEARVGQDDYRGVIGGLRFYFGKSKTLIDKHRRDDPGDDVAENLYTAQSYSQSLDKSNKAAAPASCIPSCPTSDIRLKRDIVLLSRLESGIGLYRYRYTWDDTVYVGVMAQEVMAIAPQAILLHQDGYLRVDYARLGLRLMTLDEWESSGHNLELAAAA